MHASMMVSSLPQVELNMAVGGSFSIKSHLQTIGKENMIRTSMYTTRPEFI